MSALELVADASGDLRRRHPPGEDGHDDVVGDRLGRFAVDAEPALGVVERPPQDRRRDALGASQQLAEHVVVDGGDERREADGVERVEPRQGVAQVLVEEALVAEDRHDLALAQRLDAADDGVSPTGELGVGGEVQEDAEACLADGLPRIVVGLREVGAELVQQLFVVGEDDIVLAPELPEEGRPRDPCRLRDLLDGGLDEPLAREQIDRGGDDGRASGGGCCGVGHVGESLAARGCTSTGVNPIDGARRVPFTGTMTSLWKQDRNPPRGTPFVAGERHDVIVVGAGVTGLGTALQLAREGLDVAVVEARDVGALATGSNTGKVSLLQGSVLSTLRRHHPASLVRAYVDANRAGAEWLTAFAADAGVPFTRRTAFSYAQTPHGVETVAAEAAAAHEAGLPVRRVAGDPVDGLFPVIDAVALDDQVAIDPYRLAVALAEAFVAAGGALHTGVRVRRAHAVPSAGIMTAEGPAFARHVVLATGTPIADRGLYFAKTRGMRSYCVAFDVPGGVPDGLFLSVDGRIRSLRSVTERDGPTGGATLIVGGNGHPVGRSDVEHRLVDDLIAWTRARFAGAEPVASWSAQDYESHDLIPFVGAMPRSLGRIRFATGFGKWGLTNGPAAALRLSAEIRRVAWRERPDWMNVIARRFTVPADLGRGGVENVRVGWEAASGWFDAQRTPVPVPRPAEGDGLVANRGGHPIGVSTVGGVTRAVSAVCPHLGGVLAWNDAECSWDCPLHASRFSADGARIEGPATRDLEQFPRSPGEPIPSEAPPAR